LVSHTEFDLAFKNREHLLEVMSIRKWATFRRDVHVCNGVPACGIVAAHQDRIRVGDDAEVSEELVLVGSGDGEVSV
jgi:hypothetical protein